MSDPNWLNLGDAANVVRMLAVLIPLLTALITKQIAAQGTKSIVTTIGSILLGSIAYLATEDGSYDWQGFINAIVNAFVVAITSYYGLWKPTGIAGTVAHKTQTFGIGRPPVLETDDKGWESSQGMQ